MKLFALSEDVLNKILALLKELPFNMVNPLLLEINADIKKVVNPDGSQVEVAPQAASTPAPVVTPDATNSTPAQ
jgi:hypothetical protein